MNEPNSGGQARKPMFTRRGWTIIGICAIATPLLFGVWPTSGGRVFAFLILAWMGAFIGGAAIMVMRRESSPAGTEPRKPDDPPPD